MLRYNRIMNKNPREIVLLKSRPCHWGRCFFCDYIDDNSKNELEIIKFNSEVLKNITGDYKQLEIINSGSVFELPKKCLKDIKDIVDDKNIETIYFESHYNYRHKIRDLENYFENQKLIFKMGMETFDADFRNNYLKKGIVYENIEDVNKYFKSICLMVGIKGQTREMIDRDIEILLKYFDRGCINVFVENTTPVKRDDGLINWFKEKYSHLEKLKNIEILWNNTDFGVGE